MKSFLSVNVDMAKILIHPYSRRLLRQACLLLCSAVLLQSRAAWAAEPLRLSFCYDSAVTQLWLTHNGRGVLNRFLGIAQEKLNLRIQLDPLPWKRCLRDVSMGLRAGAVDGSYSEERAVYAYYPGTPQGKLDVNRRLRYGTYALYRVRGTDVDWDGKQFSNLNGPVVAQLGYSVIRDLSNLGVATDETPGTVDVVMRKLLAGRAQVAAVFSEEGDRLLKGPPYAGKIERMPIPLIEKPYFLLVNKAVYHTHPERIEQLWTTLAQLREALENQTAPKKKTGRP
ncbi:hypothetical protein H8K47_00530 [Undibacterium sp. CY7W]|uniref:Polar amino acid transport system substrate-binding protein n=1 Tax=Undibacterium rugosum TaxID=2762291 RepID=A0A923KYT1_9BURK|nr:hypothetical protein [Undibacterium rugosum]MBC3933831.1 hypothetical protein [Undibacterium rugosum]